ncbi:FxLD family lanthipeptide [Frankia sp. Cr1]|uniref:FxLD family lanthipeptide n=1 Tax=Frankia sp. Cr1 TaxID=3073931 RepID=UPI002AD49571|nr:FxLD family lanthipeptide [Frankia sp. Cr1]
MAPPTSLTATQLTTEDAFSDDDFVLDMRVIESTTPLVVMMCDTSDNCGSTCEGSACNTSSNDPS